MSNLKHGHMIDGAESPTHKAWSTMKQRCNNPKYYLYHRYGGRGITYDSRWESFENFLADLGERPERIDSLSLDRIDNNGNYTKENCRWATASQQQLNKDIQCNNTSGLKGVSFRKTDKKWYASAKRNGVQTQLYYGKDFFEACCARKSWENFNV